MNLIQPATRLMVSVTDKSMEYHIRETRKHRKFGVRSLRVTTLDAYGSSVNFIR